MSENRFKMLTKSKPEDAKRFFAAGAAGRGSVAGSSTTYLAARKPRNLRLRPPGRGLGLDQHP